MLLDKRFFVILALTFLVFLLFYLGGIVYFQADAERVTVNFLYYAVFTLLVAACHYLLVTLIIRKKFFSCLQPLVKKVKPFMAEQRLKKDQKGWDEIALLDRQIDGLLNQLAESRTLVQILENLMDLVSVLDPDRKLSYASPSHKTLLGRTPEEILQIRNMEDFFHPDDIQLAVDTTNKVIETQQLQRAELRLKHANGQYIWFESMHYPIYNNRGELTGIIVSSRDITKRREMEERLRYLSNYDDLTGLYNRRYFEHEMRRLRKTRNVPFGIIICDLDGLKLINDGIGHKAGDQLLKNAAFIIKRCFRDEDIVARIGGDEFAVFLPNCDLESIKSAVKRIKDAVANYNDTNPKLPLSISTGYAIGYKGADINEVFQEADNSMYQDKLLRSKEAKHSAAHLLMSILETRERSFEGNMERLPNLVAKFARKLGFSPKRINDLELLARFHDIGKVGIPDRILFRTTPLTTEERQIIQRHCEIGHRIALSTPEIVHIADWILKHHEWWNGQGYPLGLQGEEIPLECRLFAIVDAYDAMVAPRHYRRPKTQEEAILELRKYAGAQFDPQLVEAFVEMLREQSPKDNKIMA